MHYHTLRQGQNILDGSVIFENAKLQHFSGGNMLNFLSFTLARQSVPKYLSLAKFKSSIGSSSKQTNQTANRLHGVPAEMKFRQIQL